VVRHVRVAGNGSLVSAAAVRSVAAIPHGTPLARVDTAGVARRVERLTPVLSARVSRSFPDTVVITVVQRTPALAVAQAGRFALVDADGVTVMMASRRPAAMPLLTAPPAVLRGSQAVRAAAVVVRTLPETVARRVKSVSASASSVTLHLLGGITVIWGGPGHARQKAAELDVLLPTHARFVDVSDPNAAVTRQ
ncbi:MAG: FtsQ-type POTRA domain-containing protein, partial [Actinobacteria bacterium]|nr:FtsQ-type POTRA domain-containing protein [Actinomycetota bacterium]